MKRVQIMIRGDVQGVGFRAAAQDTARGLGLRGWVRNRADGSVECLAEGPRAPVERLLDELREGPRAAEVQDVEAAWQPAGGDLPDFGVY